jgi:phospholipid/cholesterol/gamma-HCH transport system substrate-binding protein
MAMKPLRERNPIIVAIVGLVILAALALITFDSANLPIIGGGTGYTAYFAEDAGLQAGNEVRVAGVIVGQVTGISLAGNKVAVSFKVKNAWVGNQTTAAIEIKTLLGDKFLSLDPQGTQPQNPGTPIPLSRTTSPYDVTQAFQGFGQEVSQIDTIKLAKSLETLSAAFSTTPPYVRSALRGLASVSHAVASRDAQVTRLLGSAKNVTGTLAAESATFAKLLGDGNLFLAELQQRQAAIHSLLIGTQALATQVSGLVNDNQAQLTPTLQALDQVTSLLLQNQANLTKALALAGPYYRLLGNALGNGRWFDVYLCGVLPKSYLPPGTGPATGCEPPKP